MKKMVIKKSGQNYLINDHLHNFYHYKKLLKNEQILLLIKE